jgi:hypothetical protein
MPNVALATPPWLPPRRPFLECAAEVESGGRAPGESYRAGQYPETHIDAQAPREAGAEQVLQQGTKRGRSEEPEQPGAALANQLQAGAQPDGAHECDHHQVA